MTLFQITEPEDTHNHIQTNNHGKLALGIDLGTTNSLVAVVIPNSDAAVIATVIQDEHGNSLTPSIVHYGLGNSITVGIDAAKLQTSDPLNTISSVKRFMAKRLSDINSKNYSYQFVEQADSMLEIKTAAGNKNPVQISACILDKLKQVALKHLKCNDDDIAGVVVTVPAYFNEAQRNATKQAAELAGLKILRLINEPTAAAIAYGLDTKNTGTFLIYDLGGGTLDVSILKLTRGVFEVLAVNGNTNLGGDDFDNLLYEHILTKIMHSSKSKQHYTTQQNNSIDITKLRLIAKDIKEQLSSSNSVTATLSPNINITITSDEFLTLVTPLIEQALKPIKQALRDAKLKITQLDEVILVGGATRMPSLRNALNKLFNKPVLTNLDPEKAVAIGAAIQADMLVGNRGNDWLLLDVTPLSLGIETMGGIFQKIIPRNSALPVTMAQDFTTHIDNQTTMSIHILQGERQLIEDCRSLAKFSLKNIPPLAKGVAKIRITFRIDVDGLLTVNAVEQTTGISSSIEVKPSFGLTATQIEAMLKDSVLNASSDAQNRLLREVNLIQI